MLKDIFIKLVQTYSKEKFAADSLWVELDKKYSSRKRHYHTLTHLTNLITEITACRNQVEDWDIVLFSVFYHDIIYNVLKSDNEERSAEFAEKKLADIGISHSKRIVCKELILATKSHAVSIHNDTNLFTDADLSILGKLPEQYDEYCRQIRKEYSIYPDVIYKPGRKKVIAHFLHLERIFKTSYFFNKYEVKARRNLERELNTF